MHRKIPKVLMLGWEFPPIINGGLGVACHDLCVAMSQYAEVSIIIPKSEPGLVTNKFNVIGLNNVNAGNLEDISYKYDYNSFNEVHQIQSELNPYFSELDELKNPDAISSSNSNGFGGFSINNLYGNDVIEKVFRFSKMAAKLAMNMDFDVIHAHDWMTMVAGMEIKAQTGKPLVVHIHSLDIDRSGEESRGWVYQTEKQGMEAADLLMPVSNYTADIIHKYYGISKDKISTVHNGIRDAVPFKTKPVFDEKTVLFIGRLTRQKGPEMFLEIASKVLEKNPDVRFVMAGTGDYFQKLLEQSSYREIGHRFHLTGFLNSEKLKHLLSFADVYCMPSVSEPFGLSAVEAVQFGVPCVISKQSGVAEVLPGSLKFDFWDTHRAANYIINLLSDPVLSEKVRNDAYQNLNGISWNISAQKVIKAYQDHQLIIN
jgi:glycogen synthase